MQLHLVGGFLGSGKTTAITSAAQHLISTGKRVGIVTNDQGKYLVDTAFFQAANIPTVEITGGCFCCNYDDLETVLKQFEKHTPPDIIFAESVGSCADLIATVVKPLQTFYTAGIEVSSLSVFTDIRLLKRRLQNQPLPFHENIVYIFDKQIEEASLLVLNKSDLLAETDVLSTLTLAQQQFPDKRIVAQSSISEKGIDHWINCITSVQKPIALDTLQIDYDRYGAGEAELAWLNEELVIDVSPGEGRTALLCFLSDLSEGLEQKGHPIGHLKAWIEADDCKMKISLPTLQHSGWKNEIPHFQSSHFTLLFNARVQAPDDILREVVSQSLDVLCWTTRAECFERISEIFTPAFPEPVHRMI